MEETILEILNMGSEQMVNVRLKTKQDMAKEITTHVFEFMQWFAKSIQYNDVHDYYKFNDRIKGMISIFDTKEELYEYWLTNVK